ncbi:MAG TPA: IPT/TIG domain-containing protein [Terriglobia bacterium]|nr:IPT/TIG domain-containing protein [Terriglobia bacterium]
MLGILLTVSGARAQSVVVGYTELRPGGESNAAPTASAVFSYRNSEGVLVSEAGVSAVRLLKRGRIFVGAGTRTGLAIVNPQSGTSRINLSLRDSAGKVVNQSTLVLEPGHQTAKFVDELFNNVPAGFRGSLTFESLTGHGAITLRESQNSYLEPLYATLPVVDLDDARSSEPLTFPHFAAGAGYQTEVVLVNGGSTPSRGRIRFFGSDGLPFPLNLDGLQTSEVPYELEPDGVFRVELAGGDKVQVGYAVLTPEAGSTPSGSLIFKLSADGHLVSETGVGATAPTKAAKILIDNVGRQTGFALANPGPVRAELRISLQDRFGVLRREVTETISPGGHLSKLAHELFPTLSAGFTGFIEIHSSVPVVPITIQLTINSRGVAVLTTLPVADLEAPALRGDLIFPEVVVGGRFSTRIVLIATAASEFTLYHRTADSRPWGLGPDGGSSVQFNLAAGQGIRSFPGSDARIATVSVRDPITNLPTSEISLAAGTSARPLILVVDTLGNARDDLPLDYVSLSPNVATVRPDGLLTGLTSGFSTLLVKGGDRVATATVSVVSVERSTGGFATGVTQNASGTLFVATEDQTLLKVEKVETTLYAGTHRQAGFRNDLRLLSQFNGPSYLSVDRSAGRLYVSDSGNHAIRVVPAGNTERVVTLSGRGTPGFADGGSGSAVFNTPKGVAIDNVGFLWVVDQGNHVIRRINLVSGEVRTVAGSPGQSGNRDGAGPAARFDTPTGIAIEPESIVEQLLREGRRAPPPPVRVVVTDTKNGIIRRITENGEVSTVRSGAVAAISAIAGERSSAAADGAPLTFNSPTGIAVGPLGTIYVLESSAGQVRSILPTGEVVTVSSSGSFDNPTGIVIGKEGEIIVASTGTPLTAIRASAPVITSINPDAVNTSGGQLVEVRGANFESDAVLVIAKIPIPFTFHDTTRISFATPALPAGQTSLSLTTRAGVGVATFRVDTATAGLVPNVPVAAQISSLGEVDRYTFTLTTRERVVLQATQTGTPGPIDPCLRVLTGATGPPVTGGTICSYPAARLDLVLDPGIYFVEVSDNVNNQTGDYTLLYQPIRVQEAVALTPNIPVSEMISPLGDLDLFTFTLTTRERVVLQATQTGTPGPIDPCLRVLTGAANPPVTGGTICSYPASRLDLVLDPGIYFVELSDNVNNQTGGYVLLYQRP